MPTPVASRRIAPNLVVALVLAVLSLIGLVVAAIMLTESSARSQWDNNLLLALADRVNRLGGTYFTSAVGQTGPIWQGLYDLAVMVTSRRDAWWAISAITVSLSALTGAAVSALLRAAGSRVWVAVTVGIATAVFMWFSNEAWSLGLYSRNIVVLLTTVSLALLVAGTKASGYARIAAVVMAGVLLGLAVQSNQGSALVAPFELAVLWVLGRTPGPNQVSMRKLVGLCVLFVIVATVALASAALWYLYKGVFDDFWLLWWEHNFQYTEGTGRGYTGIVQKGLLDFVDYYARRPVFTLTIVAYVTGYILAFGSLSSWEKRLGILLVGWWLVEAAGVVLSQRFFPHYLVLSFVPVAVMAGALLHKGTEWVDSRTTLRPEAKFALAMAVIVLVLNLHAGRVASGISKTINFRGLDRAAAARDAWLSPADAYLRQVVDTWSSPDDFVLAWRDDPYHWEVIQRTSATRYVDVHGLTGYIYGGIRSPEYILPGVWENWIADLAASTPPLLITFADEPVPEGSPVESLIDCGYVPVANHPEAWTVYTATEDLDECLELVAEEIEADAQGPQIWAIPMD